MALNIKNERVHALAREAAARTGKSQTAVIEQALKRLLSELPDERARRDDETRAWLAELWAGISDEDRAAARAAMIEMYDEETGLPR